MMTAFWHSLGQALTHLNWVLYVNLLLVLLLAGVAGLLVLVWQQLRVWRAASKQAPLLADALAAQLQSARGALAEMKQALLQGGPELERLLSDVQQARVELQFLLQRGSQLNDQLAAQLSAPQPQAERVSSANGRALNQGKPVETAQLPLLAPVAGKMADPLEQLLAGLQETPAPVAAPKRRRVGPVTQAELNLQQQVQLLQPAKPKNRAA
jgi:hypothetical protein